MPASDDFSRRCQAPLLIVISGPSASGKDTVVKKMKEHGQDFHFVVTATTRERRPGEVHGKDYWFISKAEFARMLKAGELLEHAMVYGEEKGVPRAQVKEALASGRDVVMRLDVQGAESVRQLVPDALLIFISVDSEDEMVRRLQERKTETAEERAVRTATAREELKRVEDFDYVIINHEDRLDHTVDVVRAIIEAEHHRVRPRKVSL
jgi:guanylate kinase